MSDAPHATRMTTSQIADDKERLAREAQTIAEDAARFAKDVERGISIGAHDRLAQDVQRFLLRAVRYDAIRETAEMFTTELAAPNADTARAAVVRLEAAVRHRDAETVRAMDPIEVVLAGVHARDDIARKIEPEEGTS